MKRKWRLLIGGLLLAVCFGIWKTPANAEEMEDLFLSEILEDGTYVKAEFGGGYLGKEVLYDIVGERTIVQPNEGENRQIIRKKKKVTVFYGKYRGKEEYEEYQDHFPELDISFFYDPMKELGFRMSDIKEKDYQIEITEPDKLENFLFTLSYAGVLDNEVFQISSVKIRFDEACRPTELRFQLSSEVASAEQTAYVETQLLQKYVYITRAEFGELFSEIESEIAEIKPFEEVEVRDYIDELSNVVKVAEEHILLVLQAQAEELSSQAGWDKRAVFAYLEAVDNKFSQFSNGYERELITQEEYLDQLNRVYQTAHLVGSDVYTYMFESSQKKPKEKALLVIEQMGGYLDSNGMLQLKNGDSFYPDMEPHSEFLESYAECVRKAYRKKNKTYKQLDNQMIHQFRMYIDRHNIEYVRNNFEGKTDYEKLKNYASSFEFSLYYGEPSRHHNKIAARETFREQKYDKVLTPNRLSEFIINVETGEFVTEWDVLKTGKTVSSDKKSYQKEKKGKKKQIVDTESFNYAPADYVEAHQKLDVLPASPSKKEKSYLENDLKKWLKKDWKSPDKRVYKEKYRKPKDYLK